MKKHNRAAPLCGGLFRHILQALVFASQSPYSGLQNVVYLFALGEIWTKIIEFGY
jgi:hypothetical protein